jgi:FlaA1/EpsC-like NDP-sugar epimerase
MDKKKTKLEHWQIIALYMMIYDIVAVNVSYFLALWLRFDCVFSNIPEVYLVNWMKFTPIYSVMCLLIFWYMRLYKSVWQFASFSELTRVIESSILTSLSHTLFITIIFGRMPTSYYCIGTVMQFILIMTVRFSYRFVLLLAGNSNRRVKGERTSRVMLIGAGNAGQLILRDIRNAKELNEKVCCIIDDNSNKWHRFIDGVEIVGGRNDILSNVKKYKIDKIYVAVPSATAENRKEILNICNEAGCELKSLPGLYQLVNGEVNVSKMKNVEVEDLLGREPIKVNMDEIFAFIKGKVILVTGGGGSIGSELCRQIAGHNPKQLIIFDIYENNAHAIKLELQDNYPDLDLVVLIGSVRDSRKLDYVFSKYKPDVVYHAAAHKHVPLMEDSPDETIKNNALGTYKTAYAAMMNGCQRFVLISTDKAVNPTNIMGASKRLCEMVIQTFDKMCKEGRAREIPAMHVHSDDEAGSMLSIRRMPEHPRTDFVAVRFGNVLGSNGSVIPRFKEQIAKGGPVTVTHPDIIRYFMTIPEAVSLVLQAGTYAKGGEIFVLDMGAPVKIDTLARNLIKLSGYKPDVDIKVEYTGLRPGEKLYEEKLMSEEGMRTTPNNLIHIGSPIPFDTDTFLKQLQMLMHAAYEQSDNICELVEQVVPTYHPAGRNGSEEKGEVFEKQMKVIQGYGRGEAKRAIV